MECPYLMTGAPLEMGLRANLCPVGTGSINVKGTSENGTIILAADNGVKATATLSEGWIWINSFI